MPTTLRFNALLLFAAITLIAAAPSAVHAQETVILPVMWQVGDKHKIELTKEKERFRNGVGQSPGKSITDINIEVLRKLEKGYVVRWTYGRTRIVGDNANRLTEEIGNIIEGMRLDMRTDELGSITALENGPEIRSHYQKAAEQLVAWMKASKAPEQLIEQVSSTFKALSTSKAVEISAMREPSLFYLAFGGSYTMGKATEFEDLVQNPWGQEPIPTKAKLFLKQIDKEAGIATIGWQQIFDPEKAGPILEKSMAALGLPVHKDGPVFTGLAASDDGLFIFNTKSGWLQTGSWQRATKINGKLAAVERIKYRTVQ